MNSSPDLGSETSLKLDADRHLQQGVLSPLETLAQSIAGIAPSATPGMLIPIVFGFAGNGAWLSYIIATVGIIFTARCINEFAGRFSCPGSLYTFTNDILGSRAGVLTGWALMFAYVLCGAACAVEFAIYVGSLSREFFGLSPWPALSIVVCILAVAYTGYKNIKLSATLMLRLEFLSIFLILALVALAFGRFGFVDDGQLTCRGVGLENVRMGLVMAVFGFVGFESAASLGAEAKDPLVSIPRAILGSVILTGFFFVFSTYAMVTCFSHSHLDLAKCSTPLLEMSSILNARYLGHLVDVGIMVSFFAACLANLNAASRALYKMSLDGLVHGHFSRSHRVNRTPFFAVFLCAALSLSIAAPLAMMNFAMLDIVGWLGTLATFGYIFSYLTVSIGCARLLKREAAVSSGAGAGVSSLANGGARSTRMFLHMAMVPLSIIVLLFALVGSLYPLPAFPYNYLPYVFLAYMLVGLAFSFLTKSEESL